MRHINIPVFIPHLGCPHTCVFCNQRTISGHGSYDRSSVYREIDNALSTVSPDDEVEIAFFGGSFTGIDRGDMLYLLDAAQSYIDAGKVSSIRLSTRPDYIDGEILGILSRYGVRHVELGIQSLSDKVLMLSERGHSAARAEEAMKAVVSAGFELTGQMMVGLPGSSVEDEIMTAEGICRCGAKSARIYPTVVLRGTELAKMSDSRAYIPLTNEEAAYRSARVLRVFVENCVDVIRIGLCASEGLDGDVYAGEYHAAIGELTEGELYYTLICEQLDMLGDITGRNLRLSVPKGASSKAVGQKKRNKLRLAEKYGLRDIRVCENEALKAYTVETEIS